MVFFKIGAERYERPLRIAVLGTAHPFRGGIVHFNSHLVKALREFPELDVDVFYWSKPYPAFLLPGGLSAFIDRKSATTFLQPGVHLLSYTNPLSWFRFFATLRRGRYDIFLTHWVHPIQYPVFKVLFAAINLLTKTQICLIVHNSLPHEPFAGAAYLSRSVFRRAHTLVVHGVSETERARDIGLPVDKIVSAFHPIYDQFPRPFETKEEIRRHLGLGPKVFLFFGFIRPYKGLELLVSAFHDLAKRRRDVSLLIVGESFYRMKNGAGEAFSLLDHLHVDGSVRDRIVVIDRYVANEEVGRYFVVADALVAPYLSATQSGPLQIAYAFDKPVIASDLPAFRECVGVGESGYLFSAGDKADCLVKMELFLHRPLSAEQVRRYRARFTWARYVESLLVPFLSSGGRVYPEAVRSRN